MAASKVCCDSGQLYEIARKYGISNIVAKKAQEINNDDTRLENAGEWANDVIRSENYIKACTEISIIFGIPDFRETRGYA